MTYSPTCLMTLEARVPPTHDARWLSNHSRAMHDEDNLPLDPRTWSRGTVARWVSQAGGSPDRFPMNGKALCLMTEDMFAARVPGKGHKLHYEFRRRLAKALAIQELVEKMKPQ